MVRREEFLQLVGRSREEGRKFYCLDNRHVGGSVRRSAKARDERKMERARMERIRSRFQLGKRVGSVLELPAGLSRVGLRGNLSPSLLATGYLGHC